MKTRRPVLLVGAGGHCRAVIDALEAEGSYSIQGLLDPHLAEGAEIFGYKVLGGDDVLEAWRGRAVQILITVGQLKNATTRRGLREKTLALGFEFATVISPKALVSERATVGPGTVVLPGAVVNAGARIGCNVILNSQSLVEHDAVIGDDTHIATGAIVNGTCRVGDRCLIGSGAVLLQGVSVASDCVVGALSLVRKNLDQPGIYAGNPLRRWT